MNLVSFHLSLCTFACPRPYATTADDPANLRQIVEDLAAESIEWEPAIEKTIFLEGFSFPAGEDFYIALRTKFRRPALRFCFRSHPPSIGKEKPQQTAEMRFLRFLAVTFC